jgi:hypothetical protein
MSMWAYSEAPLQRLYRFRYMHRLWGRVLLGLNIE